MCKGRYARARRDAAILAPGLDMIREKTGKPVIGVLPYITDMGLQFLERNENPIGATDMTGDYLLNDLLCNSRHGQNPPVL